MPGSVFYDVGKLDQTAINLFYGWGYNFYRLENQLRADDLLVREKACWLLGLSRTAIDTAERAYRRVHLPPPSRAQPLPAPAALAAVRTLEALSVEIGQLEATIRTLPVPENDRMTQRYRQEAETLVTLRSCDQRLVGTAEALRLMLDNQDAGGILSQSMDIHDGIVLMTGLIRERQSALK